jgi:cytochrome c oxidase assembly protein subunit 15
MLRNKAQLKRIAVSIFILLLAEYAAGVILHRVGIPPAVQPVHLVFATVIFGLQFALLLRMKRN